MSLLWADFPSGQPGLYGTSKSYMLDGRYASLSSNTSIEDDPEASITGNVLRLGGTGNQAIAPDVRLVLPAEVSEVGFSARFYLAALPTATDRLPQIFQWRNLDNETLLYVRINTTGSLSVVNSAGTVLATSTGPVVVASAWQQIECKALLSATVGEFECRVEGVEVSSITLSGVDTVGSATPITCAQMAFYSPTNASFAPTNYFIKDFVVWDTSGSINNDFFGSVSVYSLLTNGDVSLNWTPSTGSTGWDLLDESPPDDADYISADDAPPAAAVMSLTNLPADVTSVRGLIAIARSVKTDGGDGNLQVSMVSNAVVGSGSDRPITTAPTYWQDVFETDPDTSAAWTPAAVDAADIQFDRTL